MSALLRAWAAAWNACDADRILELVHPDFEMHRMKGDVIGREELREAVARQTYGAAMKVFPRRLYGRDDRFAVVARIEYRYVENDELMGATDDSGMAFELRDDVVSLVVPKATAAEALERAGLSADDLIFEF